MVTSRGCPFGCNWCAKPIFGRRYAQRSPECVADEMQRLKEAVRPDHIWFADDIFGLTARWITRFADEVAARDVRTPFMIQCRADLLRPDVVAALAAAGAEEVWLGVESGSQRILDAMDKGTTVDEVRAATRALKAQGIRACWFLQLGYPSETWDDLLLTRDLVREKRPTTSACPSPIRCRGRNFTPWCTRSSVLDRTGRTRTTSRCCFEARTARSSTGCCATHSTTKFAPGMANDARWAQLARDEWSHRSVEPLVAGNG